MSATCRSCGAAIVWVLTEHNRRMPLDAKPEKRFVVEEHKEAPLAIATDTYVSHFSTCPNAAQHRKAKP
jgi:hypothetical protein